jgi:hypothetical protein
MNLVECFVKAAQKSGYILEIFIHAAIETDETMSKWISRREDEIMQCEKKMPHGLNILIGEFFKKFNITVHYSTIDNDDTLAAFANFYNASILS